MCIIGYAPAGASIKAETIRYMFKGNPDGAGIMWKPTSKSQVEIRKGFMKVEDLLAAWEQIPVECEKAVHCRIATSGKVSTACCHPFPVRAKTKAMRAAKDSASIALMHNGTIGYCTPVQGMKAGYSDTMLFASRILYPLQKQLDNTAIQTLIENSTSSRLLIFRADGEAIVLGDWEFEDGVYYSNGNYKAGGYKYSKLAHYWEDYDDTYNYGCYGYWGDYGKSSSKSASKTTAAAATVKADDELRQQEGDYCLECVSLVAQLDMGKDLDTQAEDALEDIISDAELYGSAVDDWHVETDPVTGLLYVALWIEGLPAGVNMLAGYQIEREGKSEGVD